MTSCHGTQEPAVVTLSLPPASDCRGHTPSAVMAETPYATWKLNTGRLNKT